jgi:LuxR family maltose regulon positive regulatory protein
MVQGNSNREIAQSLVLSVDTVKSHLSSIFSKLEVHTRVQAVARARVLGLLSDER